LAVLNTLFKPRIRGVFLYFYPSIDNTFFYMPVYQILIFISFIASLICIASRAQRVKPLVFFPFFLLLTLFVEYYGEKLSNRNINTTGLYNLFTFFEFLFYMIFFMSLFPSPIAKKRLLLGMAAYFVITFINIFYFQGRKEFHTYTYMLGCLIVVILCIFYFFYLFRFPESGRLTRNPYFWIVTGLMFFYTCTFTLFGLNNFIAKTIRQYTENLFLLQDILNMLLYTSFSIGFLCRLNIQKLLRLS
jgi:hypothetical protein